MLIQPLEFVPFDPKCLHDNIEPRYHFGNDGNPRAVQCRRCMKRWRIVPT